MRSLCRQADTQDPGGAGGVQPAAGALRHHLGPAAGRLVGGLGAGHRPQGAPVAELTCNQCISGHPHDDEVVLALLVSPSRALLHHVA